MRSQNQWRNENLFDNREERLWTRLTRKLTVPSCGIYNWYKRGLKLKRYPTKANLKNQERTKTATDGADSVIVEKILKSTEEENCA